MVLTKLRSGRRSRLRLRFGRELSWARRRLVTRGCNQRRVAATSETAAAYVGAGGLLQGKKYGGDSASNDSDQATKFINGVRFHARHGALLHPQKLLHTVFERRIFRVQTKNGLWSRIKLPAEPSSGRYGPTSTQSSANRQILGHRFRETLNHLAS